MNGIFSNEMKNVLVKRQPCVGPGKVGAAYAGIKQCSPTGTFDVYQLTLSSGEGYRFTVPSRNSDEVKSIVKIDISSSSNK